MSVKRVSRSCVLVVLIVATAGIALAQDNWLGGAGGWSYGYNWSLGSPPTTGDNVFIDSGGYDNVTLDTSPPTISSLTLGLHGYSYLTDNGATRTMNVTNNLHVGQYGYMYALRLLRTAGLARRRRCRPGDAMRLRVWSQPPRLLVRRSTCP